MRTCALIPAFNEVRTLPDIVEKTLCEVDHVIVVDDGSTDGTSDCLTPLPERLTVLRNHSNMGKGATLWRGFQHALDTKADFVVTLDADGQHCPGDIPRLLSALAEDQNSLVIGERRHKRQSAPKYRRFANAFADFWISLAAGERIYDSQSGFRVYPANLLKATRKSELRADGFAFETAVLITAVYQCFRLSYVPIESRYQHNARSSHYRAVHDTLQITLVVIRMLFKPGLMIPRLRRMLRHHPHRHRFSESGDKL